MSPEIRNLHRWVLSATIATYLLIFVGGLVRVSGAGLGCPDWPKCFGSWIPPFSRAQVPVEFNTGTFNVTLAWIEYINRLLGVLTGILIAGTALLSIKNFRSEKGLVFSTVGAAILVAFQGWYGSVVISSKLLSHTVSLHLVMALIIVSLLIYASQTITFLADKRGPADKRVHSGLRISTLFLWILAIIQILLGTQVRTEIESIIREFPLLFRNEVLTVIGSVNYIHTVLGIMITLISFFLLFRLVQKQNTTTSLARIMGGISVLLLVIQVMLGSALEIFGIPPILEVFHLWTASLFIGSLLILYTELAYVKGA